MNTILMREITNGDFQVVRGGDIYRKSSVGIVPDAVKAGDFASAAEVCEWMELGVDVKDASRRK